MSSACLDHLLALNHYFLNLRNMDTWNYICRLQYDKSILSHIMDLSKKWRGVHPDDLARVSATFCTITDKLLINYLVSLLLVWRNRQKVKDDFPYCLCGCPASSLCSQCVRSTDINQTCTEWGGKGSISFARVREGCGLTLGRGLDLSRLEGLRGGGFCDDQCTGLMELTVCMPGDRALTVFP